MVDAVKNSTQTIGLQTPQTPNSIGANGSTNPYDTPMFGYGYDSLGDLTSKLSIYGPMAFDDTLMQTYRNNLNAASSDYRNKRNIDDENVKPLAERIDEYRVFDIRLHNHDEVTHTLESAKESGKGVALYFAGCEEDGLIDPNGPKSISNLKNPLKLVDTLTTPFAFTAPEANENVKLLTEIAIKERSPEMAAAILEKTSEGGKLCIGTDYETAKKILIDSKDNFETKEDHARFLTNIDQASEEMFGRSLDDHIHDEYKTKTQKLAAAGTVGAGIVAGATLGRKFGKWGLLAGTVAGAFTGMKVYASHMFGVREEGETLLHALDKARNVDSKIDLRKYSTGFGAYTGINASSPVPLV